MEAVLGLHRKSLLRLIHGDLARKTRRKQRGKNYGAEVEQAVRRIAHSLDYPCAERLQPNLVWMAKHLARHGELEVNEALLVKLEQVSVSTVRRMIPPSQRTVQQIAHRKAPRAPRTTLQHSIPIPASMPVRITIQTRLRLPRDGCAHRVSLVDSQGGYKSCRRKIYISSKSHKQKHFPPGYRRSPSTSWSGG